MSQPQEILQIVFNWMDVIWLPVAFFVVQKKLRIKAMFFVLCCIIMLRLQIEMMESFELPTGIFHLLDGPLYNRGVIVYSFFIILFLFLSHYSPRVNPYIYLAASLSIFVFAFCVSSVFMIL